MSNYDVVFGQEFIPEGSVEFIETPNQYSTASLRLVDQNLKSQLRDVEPGGFLLDEDKFSEMEAESSLVTASVHEFEGFEYGRHKNSHGLIFGQMILQSMFDRQKQSFVAVKPFDTPKDALHEFAVMNYVNGFGRYGRAILAFDTLGFHRFADTGQFGLITAYDETVTSYDNIFWDTDYEPSDQEIDKALSRCAMSLARLHVFGLSHGDAQVKNMASDNVGIRFIDLESARPFPAMRDESSVDPYKAHHEVIRDISTLVGSLQTGIEDPEVGAEKFAEALFLAFDENYLEVIKHPSSRLPEEARPTKEEIEDTILSSL